VERDKQNMKRLAKGVCTRILSYICLPQCGF